MFSAVHVISSLFAPFAIQTTGSSRTLGLIKVRTFRIPEIKGFISALKL
jgi:hypothetical protein